MHTFWVIDSYCRNEQWYTLSQLARKEFSVLSYVIDSPLFVTVRWEHPNCVQQHHITASIGSFGAPCFFSSKTKYSTRRGFLNRELSICTTAVTVPLLEPMYLVFTRMPGERYRKRLRSLLYLCYVFWARINSLECRLKKLFYFLFIFQKTNVFRWWGVRGRGYLFLIYMGPDQRRVLDMRIVLNMHLLT